MVYHKGTLVGLRENPEFCCPVGVRVGVSPHQGGEQLDIERFMFATQEELVSSQGRVSTITGCCWVLV